MSSRLASYPHPLWRRGLFVVCLCLSGCTTYSGLQEGTRDEWQVRVGQFRAPLAIVFDHDRFVSEWAQSYDPLSLLRRDSAESLRKEESVYMMVAFQNCLGDAEHGLCELRVDFEVLKPDGMRYGVYPDLRMWFEEQPPHNLPVIGVAYLIFKPETSDPVGKYYVKAIIRQR